MMMDAHMSYKDSNDVDGYYDNAYGSGLYDFDQYYDVTGAIDSRKQVQSG